MQRHRKEKCALDRAQLLSDTRAACTLISLVWTRPERNVLPEMAKEGGETNPRDVRDQDDDDDVRLVQCAARRGGMRAQKGEREVNERTN